MAPLFPSLVRFYEAAGKGRRSRMQAKLMDAAVSLFAEVGIETTSVLEITNRAQVANGTFYNYFKDKDEIVRCVYDYMTDALVSSIISSLDELEDGRDQIALGTIWFVDAVASEPHWGRMMADALEQGGPFREMSAGVIAGYLQNGLDQGHFEVECTPVLLDLYLSVLAAAIRSQLRRGSGPGEEVGLLAAEMHLRMLGTPPEGAHRIPREALRRHGEYPRTPAPSIQPSHRRRNPAAPEPQN